MKGLLSVIIPSYNEEIMVSKAALSIHSILESDNIPHELIFIDDGSKDNTWNEILSLSQKTKFIRGIHFSRNFGKEAAIMAGLSKATGDCSVVIDCDLQHPPEKIIEMYRLWEQGYEIIEGQKRSRGHESFIHAAAANTFYSLISHASGIDMSNASDFKLLDKKAVLVLINMTEKNAFFRALSSWIGFKTCSVQFDVRERTDGESKWSTRSLIKYAVNNIASFSTAPIKLITLLGFIMLITSLTFSIIALVQKFAGYAVEGFTTVILLELFSSSIIMISLGIIGYYIARIYEEIKARPSFIISKTCGYDNDLHS